MQHTKNILAGLTFWDLLVIIILLVVLTVFLLPPGRNHEKAPQSQCLNNQKQVATAVQMYTQDNEERLFTLKPGTPWPNALQEYCESRTYDCPTTRKHKGTMQQPDYGFNAMLSGAFLKDIRWHDSTPFMADIAPHRHQGYLIRDWNRDIDPRHSSGVIMAFVDGHVQMMNFSGMEEQMLLTLFGRRFDPYDGAGTAIYKQVKEDLFSVIPGRPSRQIALKFNTTPPAQLQGVWLTTTCTLDDPAHFKQVGFFAKDPPLHIGVDPAQGRILVNGAMIQHPALRTGNAFTTFTLTAVQVDDYLYIVLLRGNQVINNIRTSAPGVSWKNISVFAEGTGTVKGTVRCTDTRVNMW